MLTAENFRPRFLLLALASSFAFVSMASAKELNEVAPKVVHLTRNAAAAASAAKRVSGGGGAGNGISYHGGPVMMGTSKIYYIWYGDWSNNTAKTILPSFAANLGGSAYNNINTSYTNGTGKRIPNSVTYAGSINDNYSHGKTLSDLDVQEIVTSAINGTDSAHQSARLPLDLNGVYFVLTSADVMESSGFCTQYCGWHRAVNVNGVDVKYSFVGNPDQCPSACAVQTVSPNGNAGADGMASIIVHEFTEAVTDPLGSAWFDQRGYENADKCGWTYGTVSTAANGSLYNLVLNGMQFLIQQNWVNASGGYCSMGY
jgi:Phosphate-induced protein 1 conserved region